MKRIVVALAVCVLVGCELQETQIAENEDVLIAEVILRAGEPVQQAWLHRTRSAGSEPLVENAIVRVEAASGAEVQFQLSTPDACLLPRPDTASRKQGSCYLSARNALQVTPGQTYRLVVTTPEGEELTGSTTVPGDFRILTPAPHTSPGGETGPFCVLEPMTTLELQWTKSSNAWVYASEIRLVGARAILRRLDIDIEDEPLRLFGLSLSAQDTTIQLAKEFGLFDRFDEDLTKALVFLQDGIPEGIAVDGIIAAADRNYVNWERGGNFNPSGFVRVPSVHGAGTGVFGSLVPKGFGMFVGGKPADPVPDC